MAQRNASSEIAKPRALMVVVVGFEENLFAYV